MSETLRIANCSGFYGDRLSAAREMVDSGPIDVLTGDYLAELTLMILLKDKLDEMGDEVVVNFVRVDEMGHAKGRCTLAFSRIEIDANNLVGPDHTGTLNHV